MINEAVLKRVDHTLAKGNQNMSALTLTRLRQHIRRRRASARPALPNIETALNRPFARLLSQRKPIPILFCEVVNKLGKNI